MIGLVDRHGWKKKIEGWFQPGYVVNDTQASSSVTCDPHTSVSGKSIMTPSDWKYKSFRICTSQTSCLSFDDKDITKYVV